MDDRADEALALLQPHLGLLTADEPERVEGTNPNHEGQTFDFALARPDGTRIALEVTRAMDQPFMAAGPPWEEFGRQIEAAARSASLKGYFVLTVTPVEAALPRRQNLDRIVGAITECALHGPQWRVEAAPGVSVSNHTLEATDVIKIYTAQSSAEFELGPQSQERLRLALERKQATMEKAGAAGYETHLAVIHWMLGSTASWRIFLDAHPLTAPHPQNVWTIDLNATQGRPPGRTAVECLHRRTSESL